MKRLGLLVLCALLWSAPVQAGWTLVEAGQFNTLTAAGSPIAIGPTSDAPIGSVVIVHCTAHTTGIGASGATTNMTVSDDAGNGSYTRLVERSVNNSSTDQVAGIFYLQLTAILHSTDEVTCDTGNANSEGKTINLLVWSVGAGSTISVTAGATAGSGTGTTYSTGGMAGLSAIERLWIGGISFSHSSGSITCDASFTCVFARTANTGTALTSQVMRSGYFVQSATSDDFNGTLSTTRVWNDLVVALEENAVAGSTQRNLLSTGVGN